MTVGSNANTASTSSIAWRDLIASLFRRVGALEQALRTKTSDAVAVDTYEWHLAGTVVTGASPKETAWVTGVAVTVMAHLDTAGSTETVFDLIIDGSTVASVTIPAGSTDPVITPLTVTGNIVYATNSLVVDVTSAGSGAKDLVVKLRVKSRA